MNNNVNEWINMLPSPIITIEIIDIEPQPSA